MCYGTYLGFSANVSVLYMHLYEHRFARTWQNLVSLGNSFLYRKGDFVIISIGILNWKINSNHRCGAFTYVFWVCIVTNYTLYTNIHLVFCIQFKWKCYSWKNEICTKYINFPPQIQIDPPFWLIFVIFVTIGTAIGKYPIKFEKPTNKATILFILLALKILSCYVKLSRAYWTQYLLHMI